MTQPVHIAKVLLLERNVQTLLYEVQKLQVATTENTKSIRELNSHLGSCVSHAELLAAVSGRRSNNRATEKPSNETASVLSEKIDDLSRVVYTLSMLLSR